MPAEATHRAPNGDQGEGDRIQLDPNARTVKTSRVVLLKAERALWLPVRTRYLSIAPGRNERGGHRAPSANAGFGALLLMEFDREFFRPALHRPPGGSAPRAPPLLRRIASTLFRSCLGNGHRPWVRDFVLGQIGQKLPARHP